jgi:hypothetical protein
VDVFHRSKLTHTFSLIAAIALLVGCSSDDGGQDIDGGTSTTQPTSLSLAQVEAELKQFQPQAQDVTCSDQESSYVCQATLDGREVRFYGTPTADSVEFTFSGTS